MASRPDWLAQFPLLEDGARRSRHRVWPMIEFEADDALAAAAAVPRATRVERVIICTPDKDLAQCVRRHPFVQLNRRTRARSTRPGCIAKFGVLPASIPDYLALVGDTADGFPGLPGGEQNPLPPCCGYGHLEAIPRRTGALGRECEERRRPGGHAFPRSRSRLAVSRSRHPSYRYRCVRIHRRSPVARNDKRPYNMVAARLGLRTPF